MASLEDLKRLEGHLRQEMPDLTIAFKNESWYHRVLGTLMHPFNPYYMTRYITTMGSAVYFPSKEHYEAMPAGSMVTLAHEFVHIYDSKRDTFYKLAYLFPQILVVIPFVVFGVLAGSSAWLLALPLLGYVAGAVLSKAKHRTLGLIVIGSTCLAFLVLGILLTKWLALILLGLLVVGPWPARWRVEYELRGYGMNVAYYEWCKYALPENYSEFIVKNFVGPGYYYMSWNRNYVLRSLEATRQQAGQRALSSVKPYSTVYDFLYSYGFVPRNDG